MANDTIPQRRVVCENCGEILYTEDVGTAEDEFPELQDADRLVEPSDCALCNDELDG